MFAKLFKKSDRSPPSSHLPEANSFLKSMSSTSELAPSVLIHYGIPTAASILAYDPIQHLLAVGSLDGRIKLFGGANIEGLLISPRALPFKNLEFLQNQGFLVSVSNDNEIQVWDLRNRCISSVIQWESNITAFFVIPSTNYFYVGDEYGFLSVLKYEAGEGKIIQLPYHIPPNLVSDVCGIPFPDTQSIVGVLFQPHSLANRVLIAYGSGVIVLWDVVEDRAVHVRGHQNLQLKEGTVIDFLTEKSSTHLSGSQDTEQGEKDISSLCWVSHDGSVLAVGYVDGDILLWNLSVSDNVKSQSSQNFSNDVVKIQLSSGDRRLPVIVLHWSSTKTQNGSGGRLCAYGGEAIGSEEVLTILDLDWSDGLVKVKCVGRVDLTLHGSFADVLVIPKAYEMENTKTSMFILTNPGQLHFYEFASLSMLKSGKVHNHPVPEIHYHSVIPTIEPYMTLGILQRLSPERNYFSALSEGLETFLPKKLQSNDLLTGKSIQWPLTGGVPCSLPTKENKLEQIYIGGYEDGSVRIWDATSSSLSLLSVLEVEIDGVRVAGADAAISALVFSSISSTLVIGNEHGAVCLHKLEEAYERTTFTLITETKREVHQLSYGKSKTCSAMFLILNSPVRSLQFVSSGIRLLVGYEYGQVAMLDIASLSLLYITDCVSCSRSPVISMSVKTFPDACKSNLKNSENSSASESAVEIAFVLTEDAHVIFMDSSTGNLMNYQPINPKENSRAISMYFLGVEDSRLRTNLEHVQSESLIFLCCQDAIYTYSLNSIFQGNTNFVSVLNLDKPCSWTTIFMKNEVEYGLILLYQTGEIEMRSLPDLELVRSTSMISILRWSFKNNMERTISASDKGEITMVNGCEFAVVSILGFEKEYSCKILPCLHDEALASATNSDIKFLGGQKKTQSTMPGFIGNVIKGLTKGETGKSLDSMETREMFITRLDKVFSRFPFSDPISSLDLESLELNIDDIDIDEPVVDSSSSQNKIGDKEDEPVAIALSSQKKREDVKEKRSDREKLLEGGSTDIHPKVRTREEIIAKYRNTGDAASAASQAKDKLLERQEKLDKLSQRTAELQSGAESFASMANELAKTMEKRKWWNI